MPLLELKYKRNPWKLLVCCIALNRTRSTRARKILDELFEAWPTARDMALAEPWEVAFFLRPLGLHRTRALRLIRLSAEVAVRDGKIDDPRGLTGVGSFAWEAWRIVRLRQYNFRPKDYALRRYLKEVRNVR